MVSVKEIKKFKIVCDARTLYKHKWGKDGVWNLKNW